MKTQKINIRALNEKSLSTRLKIIVERTAADFAIRRISLNMVYAFMLAKSISISAYCSVCLINKNQIAMQICCRSNTIPQGTKPEIGNHEKLIS